MKPAQRLELPFKWAGLALGEWRKGTNGLTLYEASELPPLPFGPFNGSYEWLWGFVENSKFSLLYPDRKAHFLNREYWPLQHNSTHLTGFGAQVDILVCAHELLSNFRSPIGARFKPPTEIETFRMSPDAELACFLSDGQDSFHWFVRRSADGSVDITCSNHRHFMSQSGSFLYQCSETLEEFICRFVVENEIWLKILIGTSLDTYESKYLGFYR